jgi:arylsulfatase A-like enzyme
LIIKPAAGLVGPEMRGEVCDSLVCLADLLPTCLTAAGEKPPRGLSVDGIDLFEVMKGDASRTTLFGEALEFHCVIDGEYKYHYCSAGGAELLFKVADDPYEQRDLIRAGTHPAVHQALRAKLISRLSDFSHPAVKDGALVSTKPAPDPRQERGRWPGFHSAACPSDVSH